MLFRSRADGLYFSGIVGGCRMIFLDTVSAVISAQQLDFLKAGLDSAGNRSVIIFSHHPILYCGNKFMDRTHPLKNRGTVVGLLRDFDGDVTVFSGHYHEDYTVKTGNITQFITLSALRQLNRDSEVFEIGSSEFGYRIIDTEFPADNTVVRFNPYK